MWRKKVKGLVFLITFTLVIALHNVNNEVPSKSVVEVFNTVPTKLLIPSGQLIGVQLNVEGIYVVGFSDIDSSKFTRQSPALLNGIQMGDCLYDVNGKKLNSSKQLAFYVKNSNGDKLVFTVKRNSKTFTTSVRPLMSNMDKQYKIGLWVRDQTAGVGTMTFLDPSTNKFGALGHPVNDIDTGMILPIKNGKIYNAKVLSIKNGEKGKPGEIKGTFSKNDVLGELYQNTIEGIYGNIDKNKEMVYSNREAIPVANQSEVKLGPAKILASVDKISTKYYDVYIEKLTKQDKPNSKGIVVKITDKELLSKTGGIVQGMSGCPIIQNGKLVGAITHVLVNRPDMGYGIYIEWMLKQLENTK